VNQYSLVKSDNNYLNILLVNYEYPPLGGGGGVISKDLAEEWVKLGNQVTVLTSKFQDIPKKQILNGVKIIRVPVLNRKEQNVASLISLLSYVPMAIWQADSIFKEKIFDVINTHFAVPSGPVGQYLSKKYSVPNVLTIHGGDIFDPSKSLSPHKTPLLNKIVRKILLTADAVVAQSTDNLNNAKTFYRIRRKIEIVPLGIHPNTFPTKSRESLGLSKKEFIFITIGRLIKRKNLGLLLEVFKSICLKIPSKLLIIGDGPEKKDLKQKAINLGIEKSVKFLGFIDNAEKFQYLNASDIYISTAIHEGFGIVFLEAMESGLPVISFDRGGQKDFLIDGKTGYLVPLNNEEILLRRILELLKNQSKRKEIKSFNKNYVKQFYIRNCADQYLKLFAELVN